MPTEGCSLNMTEACEAGDSAAPEAGRPGFRFPLACPCAERGRAGEHVLSFCSIRTGLSVAHLQLSRSEEEELGRRRLTKARRKGHIFQTGTTCVRREGRRHAPAPSGKSAAAGRLGQGERLTGSLLCQLQWLGLSLELQEARNCV